MSDVLQVATGPALIDAIEENEIVQRRDGFGRLPGAEFHDEADLVRYVTGYPIHWLNAVMRARLTDADADRRIEEVLAPCRARGLPQAWDLFPTSSPTDLGDRLIAHGFVHADDLPFFAIDLGDLADDVPVPAGVVIERVTDDATRERFLRAFVEGFEMPGEIARMFRTVVTEATPAWRRFVATMDGRPVATAGVHLAGGVAGLYNVQTIPSVRRRGIGAAVSHAALRHAGEAGYRVAVLSSSEMGIGVYRALGFRGVCSMGGYVWRPGSSEQVDQDASASIRRRRV